MARLTHPSKPSARHITLSATVAAAIAIALYVWLVALPASELEAQSNSAPTITAHSPSNSATVSLTTGETERFSATASDPDSNIVKWGVTVQTGLNLMRQIDYKHGTTCECSWGFPGGID